MTASIDIVILGLSITSSWGNGHATTYRALVKALERRGHRVLFLERNTAYYAANRDLPQPPFGKTVLYESLDELMELHGRDVQQADLVILGSYVRDGIAVGEWVRETANGITAIYDIDTPVTLAKLSRRDCEYLNAELIAKLDLYLSFTAGPTLQVLEQRFHSPCARPLLCSVDPDLYFPEDVEHQFDLGYLGTYSIDRQPGLERLLLSPAREMPNQKFIVAGPQYPADIAWPNNVDRIEHLPPAKHCRFYNQQRFTLNVTRSDMVQAGFSPSVRLFEAAACGTPIISDWWEGLDSFFRPDREILPAASRKEVMGYLQNLPESKRRNLGQSARNRALQDHTCDKRAEELETYFHEAVHRRETKPQAIRS